MIALQLKLVIDDVRPAEISNMDRDEALKLLQGGTEGIAEWNRRRDAGGKIPDLSGAELSGARLSSANLNRVNLRNADLNDADLSSANLCGGKLRDAKLRSADLSYADLRVADLNSADLTSAELIDAELTDATLIDASLSWANFQGANLTGAILQGARFDGTRLSGANLSHANCFALVLADVDLSEVEGLESVLHVGPSTVGLDTLFRSNGKIPAVFLRGCGVPEYVIENQRALAGSLEPIQFYSCFVSYSTADEEFASRLHNDFQAAGIRCWKWDHDARTGRSLWGEIDEAIRVYDKLVLIASEASLKSPSVNREIERALVQEDERMKRKEKGEKEIDADVLFPVTLDAYIFTKWNHERKVDVTKKVIADAKGWDSDAGIYAKVRDKLIRDLKAEASAGSAAPATRVRPRKKPR